MPGDDSTKWFFDEATKTIKNGHWKTHSLTLDTDGKIKCKNTIPNQTQFFEYKNNFIQDLKNHKALFVRNKVDKDRQEVYAEPST